MIIMNTQTGHMLPNGRVAGTSEELKTQESKARVLDLVTKENVNQQAVDRAIGLILKSVKEAAGWTRDLFVTIRLCGDAEVAKGSLTTAEQRAIKKIREQLTIGDPNYAGKIKSLNDIAKLNGDSQLTYSVTKSKIFGIIDNAEELCSALQELWVFENQHEGAPMKLLPNGYLDAFSDRYKDDKKGSTQFTRDAREAKEAEAKLQVKKDMKARELAKQAAAETGKNGEQTQQGIATGATEQHGLQIKSTQEALNKVIRLVHDADNHEGVEIAELNLILTFCAEQIQALLNAANDATRKEVAEAGNAPIKSAQAIMSGAGEPLVENGVDTVSGGSESVTAVKPDWIEQGIWDVMIENERFQAIEAGQKAWEEEDAMMEHAESLKDAESNEPVANNG